MIMMANITLFVGSYTQPEAHVPEACGEGIVTLAFDPATGRLERRAVFKEILNPSYLAFDAARRRLFAVSENITGEGAVWQFDVSADGILTPVSRQPSHGAATCHVEILPGEHVCAASYLGGCLAVYPLTNRTLAPAERVFHYQGTGANPQRQDASHAHQIVVAPNKKWFYVCDLGADRIWQHDIDAHDEPVGYPMPAGLGPRHMAFHPSQPRAYVLGELTGVVAVCDWNAPTGALDLVATTQALGDDAAAAAIRIHPSCRALWISLRKSRSLKVFALEKDGLPGAATEYRLESGEPRDFAISPDGRWLISANQSANDLAVIELHPTTGMPTARPLTRFGIGTPSSVLFIPCCNP